jgi:hypothetical protein
MRSGRINEKRQVFVVAASIALAVGATFVVDARNTAGAASAQNCFGPAPYNCYSQGDINPQTRQGDYADLYQAYADFAWQDFLALNFPAQTDADGENPQPQPSTTDGLDTDGGAYLTVWETYTEARDMFLPDGSAPRPFGSGHDLPDACKILQTNEAKDKDVRYLVSRFSKVAASDRSSGVDIVDEYIEANRMGPVIDQNGWYLRFGINFNGDMYQYIVNNTLYNEEGQQAFDVNDPNRDQNPVDWPRGEYQGSGQVDPQSIGAVMVKSAWKILGPEDNAEKFHRVLAWVYNEAGGAFGDEPTVPESCKLEWLALVGFHVVHRTNTAPQWVWSTFEHIDNAPWVNDFQSGTPSGPFSLFDPASCPASEGQPSCAYNQLPEHPWNPDRSYANPTQVVRLFAPGQYAIAANQTYKNRLQQYYGAGKTVWENYFLVDVQFPTKVDPGASYFEVNPAYPDGLPTPTFLANSTLETYIQGFPEGDDVTTSNSITIPPADQMLNVGQGTVDPWNPSGVYGVSGGAERNTSSCIGCHGDAAMTNGTASNLVFSLSRAASVTGAAKPGQ